MELTAVLTPAEEGGYVALNPETGKAGTLAGVLRQADISPVEFIAAL
jgi:hypothetical protein